MKRSGRTDVRTGLGRAEGAPEELRPWVLAAQQGDEAAFAALYVAVQPGLLRYLRALVGDDAEDVASEAWLHIARDLPKLRDTAGFRGWAAAIARHRALDHLRHHRSRPAVSTAIEELVELSATQPDAGEQAVEAISTDRAVAPIAALPRDQAEAVLLRVVMGLDAKSAAHVLGKRPGAVRVAAHRGLRRLAAWLEEHPHDSVRPGVTPDSAPAPKQVR
ncbi:RNA polymerase sigma factor [Dactylosporangium darangshiense]|uniref:RNA polymerase sigma factor n=1 Tax=Dactylosporangium darangshiense TaxID=579108 RepID=A0ABP8CT37_9ACTN